MSPLRGASESRLPLSKTAPTIEVGVVGEGVDDRRRRRFDPHRMQDEGERAEEWRDDWVVLHELLSALVFRLGHGGYRVPSDVADLAYDAVVDRHLDRGSIENLRGYAIRVLRNAIAKGPVRAGDRLERHVPSEALAATPAVEDKSDDESDEDEWRARLEHLLRSCPTLTGPERRAVQAVLETGSSQAAARNLGCSTRDLRSRVSRAKSKLSLANRAQGEWS
jgi:DNA-directed RNA polymerase specialized sigma24 family protein